MREITYPYVLHNIAKDISSDRTKGMHKNYKDKDYYVGDKTNQYNIQGVLAELIAQHYFTCIGQEYKALSILGTEPEVEADIFIGKRKIDVKYIPHYGKYLMVNHNSHTNANKDITEYMFIQLSKRISDSTASAKIWIATHNEVDKWDIVKQTNTKVFCNKL
tara:strand:+ start:195 stop:680 length:486 start_codon:yes stop_codon:yes gene_type:complete